MTPRFRLTSAAYAMRASYSDTAQVARASLSGGGAGNTLDQAYDQGGPGAGRTINADAGAVNVVGPDGLTVNGNVGIGTTNPAGILDVAIPLNGLVRLGKSLTASEVQFTNGRVRSEVSKFQIFGKDILDNAIPITFGQAANDFDVTIDTTGNVGIGTTNPTRNLEVVDDNNGIAHMGIRTPNTGTIARAVLAVDANDAQLALQGYSSSYVSPQLADRGAVETSTITSGLDLAANKSDGDIRFYTAGHGTSNEKMRITAGGNIGIGTTIPTQKLHVVGNILATGSITPGSSREFKENIAELSMPEAMVALQELMPIKFNYKADEKKDLHLGFIAEEVPELLGHAGSQRG